MGNIYDQFDAKPDKNLDNVYDQFDPAHGFNPDGTIGTPPPGMVLDERTGQMVDTQAAADRLGTAAKAAGTVVRGIPFVGEGIDEAMGAAVGATGGNEEIATETARRALDDFEEENPKTALGLRIAGGIGATVPAAVAAGPAIAGAAPSSLGGQMLAGGTIGGGVSALEGASAGYLSGTDPKSRLENAKKQAWISGVIGGALGLGLPVFGEVVKKGARKLMGSGSSTTTVRQSGVSKDAAKELMKAVDADEAYNGIGAANIAKAGDEAFLADSGKNTIQLLDTAIQSGGPGATTALRNVHGRATRVGEQFKRFLDDRLGPPTGTKKLHRNIAQKTATAREAAYQAAENTPINYSSVEGRAVESVLDRVPDSVLAKAIKEANDEVVRKVGKQAAKTENLHILADIADDGTVTFRELPNVKQLHFLKMAMDKLAKDGTDPITGKMSGDALSTSKLASDLRNALKEAVPDYRYASQLGKDKIAEQNAVEMGRRIFDKATTLEDLTAFKAGMNADDLVAFKQGMRRQIEDIMDEVGKVISDPHSEARQAYDVWKKMSKPAVRKKMAKVLGQTETERFYRELDKVESALMLKANIRDNSLTAARLNKMDLVNERHNTGVLNKAMQGEPLGAPKEAWKKFWGTDADSLRLKDEELYAEIADILTRQRGARGFDPEQFSAALTASARDTAGRDMLAEALKRGSIPAVAIPAYHGLTQSTRSKGQGRQ